MIDAYNYFAKDNELSLGRYVNDPLNKSLENARFQVDRVNLPNGEFDFTVSIVSTIAIDPADSGGETEVLATYGKEVSKLINKYCCHNFINIYIALDLGTALQRLR